MAEPKLNPHDQGEVDRSEDNYNPPHDNPRDNIFGGYTDKQIQDRKDYSKGWNNAGD